MQGPAPRPTQASSADVIAAMLAISCFAWCAHASVVLASAIGLHPLGGKAPAWAILIGSFAASLTVGTWAFRRGKDAAHGASLGTIDSTRELPRSARVVLLGLPCLAVAALVACAVRGLSQPITAYDAVSYRLPVIAQWLDHGRVAWVMTDDAVRNGYPMGQEAISAATVAATGTFRFAGATSFLFLATGALSVWAFAEGAGVGRVFARAGASVFALVPMVLLNAPSGYVDAAFGAAAVSLFCLAALVACADTGALRVPVALGAGMAASHVLCLKGTGVAFVGLTAALALVVALRARRFDVGVIAPAILTASVGAFWVLRNVVHTGNPLYPVAIAWRGHPWLAGVGSVDAVLDVAHNTPSTWLALTEPERVLRAWLQLSGPATDFDERTAGLGYAWPLIAVPSLVGLVHGLCRKGGRSSRQGPPLLFLAAVTAGCLALQPMRWWARYTIWLWGLGAVAIAARMQAWVLTRRTRAANAALFVLGVLMAGEGIFAILALFNPRTPTHDAATFGLPATFFHDELEGRTALCRGAWKPGSDNALVDGVAAQLRPRPRVVLIADDDGDWSRVRRQWKEAGCQDLLLFRGSPVLGAAAGDPDTTLAPTTAFDPAFLARAR